MIVFVQIDTTLPLSPQLATIAAVLRPSTIWDTHMGNLVEDEPPQPARDEAHTNAPDTIEDEPPQPAPVKRPRKVTVPDCFDGAPLVAYLRANGPQTIGELVRAMGGNPDAMRAALDAVGAVKSGKAKGTRYSMPVEAPTIGAQD